MKALPGLVENPRHSPHLFDDRLICTYCDRDMRDQEHEPIPCPKWPGLTRSRLTKTGKPFKNYYKNHEKRTLTPEQVRIARELYAHKPIPSGALSKLSREWGVNRSAIYRAGRGVQLYAREDI